MFGFPLSLTPTSTSASPAGSPSNTYSESDRISPPPPSPPTFLVDYFQSPASCSLSFHLYTLQSIPNTAASENLLNHVIWCHFSAPTPQSQGPHRDLYGLTGAVQQPPPFLLLLPLLSQPQLAEPTVFSLAVPVPGMLLSWVSMTHFLTSFSSFFKYYLIFSVVPPLSILLKQQAPLPRVTLLYFSPENVPPSDFHLFLEYNSHEGGVLICFIQCCISVPDTYWYLNSPLNKQNNSHSAKSSEENFKRVYARDW